MKRELIIEEINSVTEELVKSGGCYIPKVCDKCDQKGFTRAWGEELMFICMWREWPPTHWFKLHLDGECPALVINGVSQKKK